jgi:hypothetical protein
MTAVIIDLLAGCAGPARASRVGPVTVVVTDEQTRRPVVGIPVNVAWEVVRLREGLGGKIEPFLGTKVVSRGQAVTDAAGTARLAAELIRLESNEQLFRLHVFVNLEVDPSATDVVAELGTIRARCRRDARACSGVPSLVDVAIALLSPTEPRRAATFRNPQSGRRGLTLMVGDSPSAPDWSTPDDPFRVRWIVARLQGELNLSAPLAARTGGEQ